VRSQELYHLQVTHIGGAVQRCGAARPCLPVHIAACTETRPQLGWQLANPQTGKASGGGWSGVLDMRQDRRPPCCSSSCAHSMCPARAA